MNIKLLTIITFLFLCLIFGFQKITYSLDKVNSNEISELAILKFLPKYPKTVFISNTESAKIINYVKRNYEIKDKEDLKLIQNTVLAYLGIDLGKNKIEDIYNNELSISTYENKEKSIDDLLIIFKLKETKDINDLLNYTIEIDDPQKLIKIYRENKLNYLEYIYLTNDNYIITSSNKNLILEALHASNINTKESPQNNSYKTILNNFKNEHNILLTKNFITNELLNNEKYSLQRDDYLITFFDFKEKKIILRTYLINNTKSLNSISYKEIDGENILDKKNYQILIYNNLSPSNKYLNHTKINSFEKALFEEVNNKLRENVLILISENNWIIIFDKNSLPVEDIKLLEDFNRNSLENNNNIYTIYSKNVLKKEESIIKQENYKKIFSIQSDNLTFLSDSLISDEDINLISKEFVISKGDNHAKYFLNKKINIKNHFPSQTKNLSYLENFNYLFQNIIKLSFIKFKAVIKQSIPETTPIYYTEINLKIF